MNFQLKSIFADIPVLAMVFIWVVGFWAAYGLYILFGGIVYGFYRLFMKDEKWYDTLTRYKIKVSLTNGQYEEIKDNKIFFQKFGVDKPSFSYHKVDDWINKIIETELDKLKRRKNKNEKKQKKDFRDSINLIGCWDIVYRWS